MHTTATPLGVQLTAGLEPVLIESNKVLALAPVFPRYAEDLAIIRNCCHC